MYLLEIGEMYFKYTWLMLKYAKLISIVMTTLQKTIFTEINFQFMFYTLGGRVGGRVVKSMREKDM